MTISQAIELCDQQKPNAYTDEDKIHWLSKLDGMIFDEVISRHEGAPEAFNGYTAADYSTELLADDAYSDMYVKWLFAQVDFANAEIARYKDALTPAIILIPGKEGSLGIGMDNVKTAVERAVGADIL